MAEASAQTMQVHPKGLSSFFTLTGLLVLCVLVVFWLNRPMVASVEGSYERVNTLDVLAVVEPFLGSGLLAVDLSQVQQQVESLSWVDRARVQRRWPNRLVVIVSEHVAAARWGDQGLLNTRGEVFIRNAKHIPTELPLLNGPDGSEWLVAQKYMEIRGVLVQSGFGLNELTLSARGAWRVILANGVELRFGREHFDERLNRFIKFASPLILKHENKISYVDLRYGNGFSVGWKEPVPGDDDLEIEPNA